MKINPVCSSIEALKKKSDFSIINKSESIPKTCRGRRACHSVAASVFVPVFSLGV